MEAQRSAAYWCQLGGIFTVVHAATPEGAHDKAARAMQAPTGRPSRSLDGMTVRVATMRERRVWGDLLAQDLAWKDAAALPAAVVPDQEQLTLVA